MALTLTRAPDGLSGSFASEPQAGTGSLLATVDQAVSALRPDVPLVCVRPETLRAAAATFVGSFPGRVLYAVKCNPDPQVLLALAAGGVRHFDVASLGEIMLLRRLLPDAFLAYMHPVKTRPSIRSAYDEHGVRDFAVDTFEELVKILDETDRADDLALHVRLALPKGSAVCDLSGKFGVIPDHAAMLLRAARAVGRRVGLCFHTGSQGLDPQAFRRALDLCGDVIRASGVTPDVIDVGGGFPVSYPDQTPPDLALYMAAIREGFAALHLPQTTELWCEPGRALVGAGTSVVVQVLKRRGNELYITDGMYGTLSDAGLFGFRFPVRVIRPADMGRTPAAAEQLPFFFWGPTCDSADKMPGPFMVSADVREGDYLELGQTGGYGTAVRTRFNGFERTEQVAVCDPPLLRTPGLDDMPARPLFVYGTLMDREMLVQVLGRPIHDLTLVPATLAGHACRRVKGEDYPALAPRAESAVSGLMVYGLSRADQARLTFYEGDGYVVRQARVAASDGTTVEADLFAPTKALAVTEEAWSVEAWRRRDKIAALRATRELMRLFGRLTPHEVDLMWPRLKHRSLDWIAAGLAA
ncbi:MAG: gamma-glutamylcyclotransferase [Alphaproteobacteria bacterium]|nr:gamma-glutamylcyclotransferase [Alphaproteobacteria bacterium]